MRVFSKLGGPGWLAVAANGTLSGVPSVADRGPNKIFARVTDANGAVDTATLQINVIDPPGLVARYAFDGNANAAAGGLNGVPGGSPTYGTGINASAIYLNGTNAYVSLPSGTAGSDEITIAAWFWRDSTASWQRLFDFGSSQTEYMYLSPRSASTTIRFGIKNGGAEQQLNTPSLPTGQWVHVAVTLGANVGRLYVNGAMVDTQTITIKPTDFLRESNYIGKSQFADPLFSGRIDEFLIFNQVLSAAQIGSLANATKRAPDFTVDPIAKPVAPAGKIYEQTIAGTATDPDAGATLTYSKVSGPEWLTVSPDGRISGVPAVNDAGVNRFVARVTDETLLADDATLNITVPSPTGLIAHYQFDGNTANALGGAAATTTGSPAYEGGYFDGALGFDGTDDFAQLAAGSFNGVTDFTIATRIRWDGGNAWQRIFDFGQGTNNYFFLCPATPGGNLRFAIKNGGSELQLNTTALNAGDWASIAVTLSGTTGTLYLNGVAVATGSITITPAMIAPTLHYLGKSQFAADPFFNGAIDDFRIYNRALSAAEVSALTTPPAAVAVSDSSFSAWTGGYPLPAGQSGALSNPDGDDFSNAWEYLFGLDPLAGNSGVGPVTQVRSAASLGLSGSKNYLTLTARVRSRRLGAMFVPEAASSVAGLSTPDAAQHARLAGTPVPDGEFEYVTYYHDVAIEDSPTGTGAIRLRLVVP